MKLDIQNAVLLVLCLAILLAVLSMSAGAVDGSELAVLPSSWITVASVQRNGQTCTLQIRLVSGTAPVYFFLRPIPISTANAVFAATFVSTEAFVAESRTNIPNNSGQHNATNDIWQGGVHYQTSWGWSTTDSTYDWSTLNTYGYPVYASGTAGLNAANDLLLSQPDSFQYTLPPGNVAYIPIPSYQTQNISYTLTTTYYMAFGNNDTSHINQVVTVMSSLPSSSNNLAPSSPLIPWTNNGNLNLFGISANKIYQGSIPSNYGGQYLVVVNPMTMPSQAGLIGGEIYTNGSINISVSAVSGSPHIYPMTESLVLNPGDDIGSESTYGDTGYTYTVDPDTGEIIWSDPYGGDSAPVAGGNNPMPTPNTIFDWLRNISQQFSDFLRGPVQAVQVVVSAIRDFMASFTQLYQWLPSPVYSLITSALMIALTIGVIKIFV